MKRVLATSLIVSIAVIALFGALAMQHASEHGHVGCLAAASPAPACPASDVIAMFLFHAEILKSLLLAVVTGYTALALLSLLFVIAFVLIRERAGPAIISRYLTPLFLFEELSLSIAPFTRWLALHENSPSFS
ncbi:hypothetical protein HY839_04035 [Candidatus Azambacteria bacterium]|nr:hypothetical protein [Candidatus Azambacteria bacterium]